MLRVSEYYHTYEQDFKNLLNQLDSTSTDPNYILAEAMKCIQQMESEISTIPKQSRSVLQKQITTYKRQWQQAEERNARMVLSGQHDLRGDLQENDCIIDEIDKLTSETQEIAKSVDTRLGEGTMALHGAKTKKQELKSHIRKADLTISMMNRKIVVDKSTLYIIVILLGIIDVLAVYKKLY